MTDTQKLDAAGIDTKPFTGEPASAGPNGNQAGPPPGGNGRPPGPGGKPGKPPRVDKADPRYRALRNFALSISVFNIIGYTVLGFEQPWAWPFIALAVGYTLELTLERISAWAHHRPAAFSGHGLWGVYTFLLPAHITALVVNMLLYANDRLTPIVFGVVVGIGAKYVLRAPIKGRWRHYMNPSNFGITVTLLAFGSWVSIAPPYHFTENVVGAFDILIPLLIVTAGTVLNAQLVKKIPLIVGFLGAFVIQALVRWWIWDIALVPALAMMSGVAFVLFVNYMITDPGTTPVPGRAQFMFGSSIGIIYGVLMVFNVVYTMFFAVTIVCGVRGLYWLGRWVVERRRQAVASAPTMAAAPAPAVREAVAR